MDELFNDMQKKGLTEFKKEFLNYNAREFTRLVKVYDDSLPYGQTKPNITDAPFPLEFVIGKSLDVIGIEDRRN